MPNQKPFQAVPRTYSNYYFFGSRTQFAAVGFRDRPFQGGREGSTFLHDEGLGPHVRDCDLGRNLKAGHVWIII